MITITVWIATLVFSLYVWDLAVSVCGFRSLPRPHARSGGVRFAVLTCAHNEEKVIAGVVRSLRAQDYDPAMFHIYVVADHCGDHTAEVARQAGATVLARDGEQGRTKGYALQWGIAKIRELRAHDALCVLDADNLVPVDFLTVLSRYVNAGHCAIQAYLDTKNPTQTWVTRCIAAAYWVTNRFWFRARWAAGLSVTLGGTGFCLKWRILDEYPWDPGSLADDLELTMKLIQAGIGVSYCAETRTYDEKPLTLRQSLRQRSRWMQGHNDVAFRWVWPVLKGLLKTGSPRRFDALLHLLQPMRMLLAFCCLLVLAAAYIVAPEHPALAGTFHLTPLALMVGGTIFVLYPLITASSERRFLETLLIIVPFLLYSFTWIPAIVTGLLRFRRRIWVHTAHG